MREKPTPISFLGLSERCQYCAVATGFGSTVPAVYAACQMFWRLTRRVISCSDTSTLNAHSRTTQLGPKS